MVGRGGSGSADVGDTPTADVLTGFPAGFAAGFAAGSAAGFVAGWAAGGRSGVERAGVEWAGVEWAGVEWAGVERAGGVDVPAGASGAIAGGRLAVADRAATG